MASGDDEESSTTTKAAPRKRAAKKEAGGGAPAKKQAAKKQAARKSTRSASSGSSAPRRASSAPRAEARPRLSAAEVGQLALQQLGSMTGTSVESITGMQRTDDGWKVEAVVVELRRVPNTTDVLASYEVMLDNDGALQGFRRLERYSRGDTRSDQ